MDPNLAQIRSFVAIAKLGSFTRAARAVNLSQPAVCTENLNPNVVVMKSAEDLI